MGAIAIATRARASGAHALRAAALDGLNADFEELLFLARSAEEELADAVADLGRTSRREPTRRLLARELMCARGRHEAIVQRLLRVRERRGSSPGGLSLVREFAAEKASLADLLRVEQALTAALVGAAEWQSPSFLHSDAPRARRHEGRIRAHWNDDKRDRRRGGGGAARGAPRQGARRRPGRDSASS